MKYNIMKWVTVINRLNNPDAQKNGFLVYVFIFKRF